MSHLDAAAQQVAQAQAAWQEARQELAGQSSDARTLAVDAHHLVPAEEGLAGLGREVARQGEAAERVRLLAEQITHQAQTATARASEAETAARCIGDKLAAVGTAVDQAVSDAAQARALVEQALALVGGAGAGCGMDIGAGALRGELDSLVRRGWMRDAHSMVIKEFAKELAFELGTNYVLEPAVERALGVDGGVGLDALVDAIRDHHPVLRAQVEEAVDAVRSRLGL